MIELTNKKLHDLVVLKDELVWNGRAISQTIEDKEKKVKAFEEKEKKITAKIVPPKELTDKGDSIALQIGKLSDELDAIAKQINDSKLEAVPKEMKEEHMQLLKEIEGHERDRNKIALKVQKLKDKMIPILKKEVQPLLGEYEDTETVKAKDGKVLVTVFSYLEDFKKRFKR